MLFNICKKDGRSNTGTNIRETLRMTKKFNYEDLNNLDFDALEYFPLEEDDIWKIEYIKHAMKEREVRVLDDEEEEIFTSICIN